MGVIIVCWHRHTQTAEFVIAFWVAGIRKHRAELTTFCLGDDRLISPKPAPTNGVY